MNFLKRFHWRNPRDKSYRAYRSDQPCDYIYLVIILKYIFFVIFCLDRRNYCTEHNYHRVNMYISFNIVIYQLDEFSIQKYRFVCIGAILQTRTSQTQNKQPHDKNMIYTSFRSESK